MPVLSPHRSSSSGLTGSYRTTYSTPSLDRPYYSSTAYSPRFSYSERFSSRTYSDSDGRKILTRAGSITEDGITTRFREETCENNIRRDSLSRDSGITSIRENSIFDTRRESSLSRSDSGRSDPRLSTIHVVESVTDFRNKYSPANYVPAHLRNKDTNNIARSKTLNDIGLPPIESSKILTKKKVTELNINNASVSVKDFPNNTNCIETDMCNQEDDNGNRPSVSEMRKKFDSGKNYKSSQTSPLMIEGAGVKISENRFKKLDGDVKEIRKIKKPLENGIDAAKTNGHAIKSIKSNDIKKSIEVTKPALIKIEPPMVPEKKIKSKITQEEVAELRGGKSETKSDIVQSNYFSPAVTEKKSVGEKDQKKVAEKNTNHVNNFSSYIPNIEGDKNDTQNASLTEANNDAEILNNVGAVKKINNKDITTSPNRINRSPLSQNVTSSTTNSIVNNLGTSSSSQCNSLERESYKMRDFDDERRRYDRISPGKQMGLNGLKNIGNTCFMNSVIQCLSNTKPLLEYVRKEGYLNDINTSLSSMKGALIKAFAQVIKELWSEDSSDRVVNTVSLKSQIQRFAPRFMGYSQQDAQEFLRYLLEGLHEDVNRVTSKITPLHVEIDEKLSDGDKATESWSRYIRRENSKVVDIFVGQLKSTLKCTHCGHCSVTFDPFWDLSLPIPQKQVGSGIRLSQCLESFTREETLDGDEKPTCSKCKERRRCTKSFTIHKFPKILVIHLKRFSPTERYRGKLSVNVDFPLEGLDMSNYAAESHTQCRYNLYAISNHSGTTYSGHYTAYCRHPYSMSWHEYNDSRVSTISPKSVVTGEAYVLFYELDSKLSHL